MRWRLVNTDWGWCGIATTAAGLRACTLPQPDEAAAAQALARATAFWGEALANNPTHGAATAWERALQSYFAGRRPDLEQIPLDWRGATAFRQQVWKACRAIPYGHTLTYGQLAALLRRPGAARAVGQALGANPLPVVVPCHRVVGATGKLVGFGAGLQWKERLLTWEREG